MKCLNNIRQLGMAFIMYAGENKSMLPVRNASRGIGAKQWDWIYWQANRDINDSLVVHYLAAPGGSVPVEVLRCPSDDWENRPLNGNSATDGPYKYSYTASTFVMNNSSFPMTNPGPYDRPLNLGKVKNASDKIFLAEEDERTIDDGHWVCDGGTDAQTPPSNYLAIRHDRQRVLPDDGSHWLQNLDRRGNVAFLDGHAEYVPRRQAHDKKNLDPEND